jgi:tetratricopeptide (TPR) repeat protein
LLLSVSQVAEARADIEEALRRNLSEATAHALRSIIALVQNQKKEALRLARQAVELEPQSPVPQVALSYAYQATFDLEKALKSLEQAAKLTPENALIHARLAELELSRGELERALKAARRAVALDPELARTQTVLGFAYLTQIRTGQAKSAFERAITLDSADPLPRLGLGLAKIREGHLTEGIHEIEIAASLDPNNSLIRSYLGKAYYEEKREGLAAREIAIAKDLDPQDPTPWFYDAIHKQSVNRPVEALRDLQRSIELNDNRAVYRSRFLLDEDLAARGAALGRIYKELGFEQSALVEGWKSLSNDPSDHSAHRLLSDTYTALPRHEVARVSELLQSQLLQSTNITPVQPQLAESDLFLLGGLGPSDPSLNEFNPLLFRNRLSLLASGLAASQGTYGDEVVQSGIWGALSYSLGQFHYESDGFRPNNDLDTNIYTAYAQYALNPLFSVQVELRTHDIKAGDLREFSNPDFQVENLRQSFDRDTARVGLRWSLDPTNYLLGSFAYRELNRDTDDRVFSSFSDILTELDLQPLAPLFPEGINSVVETTNEVDNKTFELQYNKQWKPANVIVGIGYTDQDRTKATRRRDSLTSPRRPTLQQDLEDVGLPPDFANEIVTTIDLLDTSSTIDEEESQESHLISYLYSNIRPLRNLDVTIGTSIHAVDRDSDQSDDLDVSNIFINPKIGVMWEPFGATTIRAAWLRTVKRPFASGQTVEPTQVAGFNQLFDDADSTRFQRYGFGVDQRLPWHLNAGFEFTWRDLEIPKFFTGVPPATERIAQEETAHRAYVF